MLKSVPTLVVLTGLLLTNGCKRSEDPADSSGSDSTAKQSNTADGLQDSEVSKKAKDEHAGGDGHAHDEAPLGKVKIGEHEVELAQGHGKVQAGKEGHLVVKLPYNDNGETIVRAWLGTEDRTLSMVGKGEYAPSHDDYDIHAVAPDPLPENVMWWIEIQKPDGTKATGAIKPKH